MKISLASKEPTWKKLPYGKTNIEAIMKERKSEIPNMLLACKSFHYFPCKAQKSI